MIAIVNVDKNIRAKGVHTYEVRVNCFPVVKFKHNREDSLDIFLLKASKAVKNKSTKKKDLNEG